MFREVRHVRRRWARRRQTGIVRNGRIEHGQQHGLCIRESDEQATFLLAQACAQSRADPTLESKVQLPTKGAARDADLLQEALALGGAGSIHEQWQQVAVVTHTEQRTKTWLGLHDVPLMIAVQDEPYWSHRRRPFPQLRPQRTRAASQAHARADLSALRSPDFELANLWTESPETGMAV